MGKGKKWSPEEIEHLEQCVGEGKTPENISEDFHMMTKMNVKGFHFRTPDAIKRKSYDLPGEAQPRDKTKPTMHGRTWHKADDTLLKHMVSMGVSWEDIASELGRTPEAARDRYVSLKKMEGKSFISRVTVWLSNLGGSVFRLFSLEDEGEGK